MVDRDHALCPSSPKTVAVQLFCGLVGCQRWVGGHVQPHRSGRGIGVRIRIARAKYGLDLEEFRSFRPSYSTEVTVTTSINQSERDGTHHKSLPPPWTCHVL